jgi:hypothetical protein
MRTTNESKIRTSVVHHSRPDAPSGGAARARAKPPGRPRAGRRACSGKPDDVQDEAVRDLLASMEETQLRAMSLYARYLEKRK